MKKIFKGKKVVVMGLGLHGGGAGVAKFFAKQGAKVLVTDLKTKDQLAKSIQKLRGLKIDFVLGHHRAQDFENADLIIKNPAVPVNSFFLTIARDSKVKIATDIDIFFDLCKAPIVGVTGTKGKSTVATLIYEILKRKCKDAILAGNIGVSPLEFFDKIKKRSYAVLELSSFELENIKKSPAIAVITSIFPDHLDRYASFKEYIKSKEKIFLFQRKSDYLVLNYDNPEARSYAKDAPSKVYYFSNSDASKELDSSKMFGCFIRNGMIFFDKEEAPILKINETKLKGEHNASNILAAMSVAKLLRVPDKIIKKAIRSFKGVPSRQEFVAEINGVKYFNDTTATMPEATIAAIKTFKENYPKARLILIGGGQNKNLNYKELAGVIIKNIQEFVLLPGTASDLIKREMELRKSKINISSAKSMEDAVRQAAAAAKPGDIVLLSPAAASFNLFKNEFDRGGCFIKAVKDLKYGEQKILPS